MVPPGLYNVKASDPCGPQDWYEEESLDVEAVHSMAPGAFILYGGITCSDPGNTALYHFIDNHLADIVTNSYGFNGEALPTDFIESENEFFMQAAAEGMSIVFSSGDDGNVAAANGIASGSFEATSPYVTGVGGTSLALRNARGVKEEWGWGTYRAFLGHANKVADRMADRSRRAAWNCLSPFYGLVSRAAAPACRSWRPAIRQRSPSAFRASRS